MSVSSSHTHATGNKEKQSALMHSSKTGKSFIMPSQSTSITEAKAWCICKKAGVH